MDPANTSSMSGTHLQQQYNANPSFSNFIDEIDAYASADDGVPGNEDLSSFPWDPALFAGIESNSTYHQQQQQQQPSSMSVNLNQTLSRQSNSPALQQQQQSQPPQQQHHPTQSQYPQPNYAHSIYEPRNMSQPTFDERFMTRPSASPTPFDHSQAYQQMPYNNYFQPQYSRQASTPTQFYNQRPVQQSQPLINIAARPPSQTSQAQQPDSMQFHQYPNNQRMSHTFVNPSMVNSSHMVAMNQGAQQNPNRSQPQPQQQYQSSPYFQKAGSTVDPQILHAIQMQNYPQLSTLGPQQPQQPTSMQQQPQTQNGSIAAPNQQAPNALSVLQQKATKELNAPKKASKKMSKVKKEGESESDSSDDLEIEGEPPEVKPALLVISPPTDEKSRALYNAVEAVWYPRNRSPPAEAVRRGIAAFGETVRSLRDAWKAKNELLKKAELPSSETAPQVPQLKEDVAHYRQTMELVLLRSETYGHSAIIKRLGENQFALSALYSFLLDRFSVGDYDSTLVSSIFKLATQFETVDEEMLEQVKWSKILQRSVKKATNESKDYAQKIVANAAAASARKKVNKADGGPGSPASVNGSKSTGVKRVRDGDLGAAPAPKKLVKPASKPLALQSAERRKALEKESMQKGAATKATKSATIAGAAVASRPKVAMTAPSKPNAFASLLSASKKPGTSNAEKAAAAATATKDKTPAAPAATVSTVSAVSAAPVTTVKRDETKRDSPPRIANAGANKSASSFLGFLADMDKPKEAEPKKADVDPNETDEQRAKRLRKEARRKLRVTWKPDNDLVQTKLFTHDPEEETGQTDSMMRDAGDTMKEGEMLKRHRDMEDVDDEEEDEGLDDTAEYSLPSEVDFGVIDHEREGNYVKYGGPCKPESAASQSQDRYEENTLMTTYTFKSDRPETPKELPSVNDDDDFQPEVDFGDPGDLVRRREKDILARKASQTPAAAGTDLATQLRALMPQQQQQQQPQAPGFNLSAFSQQSSSQPGTQQPAATADYSKLFTVVQQFSQMQQVQQPAAPPPQPVAQTYQPPAATSAGVPPNLAAIMAQLSSTQSNPLPMGNAGNPNPFPGNTDFGRKHGRAEESNDQGNKKKKKAGDGKPYNYKTVTCQFWVEGKCTKGDNCTYKHEL